MDEMKKGESEPIGEPEVFILRGGVAEDGGVWGTIFNTCTGKNVAFCGLDKALLMINSRLTERAFLPEGMELRSFYLDGRKFEEVLEGWQKQTKVILIKKEVFLIRVFFHEHTSWQGMICWKDQQQYFRRVLELMFLIWSVLAEPEEVREVGKTAWN